MTSRQQRRAAERKARKQAIRKHASPLSSERTPLVPPSHSLSTRTGPRADYTALIDAASPAFLFPGEDRDRYRAHLRHYFHQHQPEPGPETHLVQRLADLQWRLQRMATLEAGVMALGRHKYAELFAEATPELRHSLIDAHTLAVDGAVIKTLHTQEVRLRRYYQHDLAELALLQEERLSSQAEGSPAAQGLPEQPCTLQSLLSLDEDGFEFSTDSSIDQPEQTSLSGFPSLLPGSAAAPELIGSFASHS